MATLLAGDLGGTNARLGIFRTEGDGAPELVAKRIYPSADLRGIEEGIARLLDEIAPGAIDAACFGVAGAVTQNRATLTNLGWLVEGAKIRDRFAIPRVILINDLVATALGLHALDSADLAALDPGVAAGDANGNAAVLGIGTGLGMAFLVWAHGRWVALPSEGGHIDFAPRNEEEWRLRSFLAERLGGRVSAERVVSGPGLHAIYEFLVAQGMPSPPAVAERIGHEDPSRVVAEVGLAGSCDACARALDLFASALGALAGGMALLATASGGVYLGGGVAAKLLPKLADGTLMRSFYDVGRLRPFVEKVPVRVVLREETAFLGAARHAAAALRG